MKGTKMLQTLQPSHVMLLPPDVLFSFPSLKTKIIIEPASPRPFPIQRRAPANLSLSGTYTQHFARTSLNKKETIRRKEGEKQPAFLFGSLFLTQSTWQR
jgi:hypothetical protein